MKEENNNGLNNLKVSLENSIERLRIAQVNKHELSYEAFRYLYIFESDKSDINEANMTIYYNKSTDAKRIFDDALNAYKVAQLAYDNAILSK